MKRPKKKITINWEISIFNIVSLLLSGLAALYALYDHYVPPNLFLGPIDRVAIWADDTDAQVPTVRFAAATSYLNRSSSEKVAIIQFEYARLTFGGKDFYFESQLQGALEYLKETDKCPPNANVKLGQVVTIDGGAKLIGCQNTSKEKIKLFNLGLLNRIVSGGDGVYRYSLFEPSRERCTENGKSCPDSDFLYLTWSEFLEKLESEFKSKASVDLQLEFGVGLVDNRIGKQTCYLKIDDIFRYAFTHNGFAVFDRCIGSKGAEII